MAKPIKLPIDYQNMRIVELVQIKIAMTERIDEIKSHLTNAQKLSTTPETGFGSASWRERASKARKAYERDIMLINAVIKEKGTQSSQAQQQAIGQAAAIGEAFMRVSRRRLTESLYDGILKEAKEEIANGQ